MATGVWLVLACTLAYVATQTDKTADENRPYKFGFNIQGYQHRKEEKDENGIINGEYGFITADGYYRITVYATDENGSFKIISMKNIYVGFPPEDPTTTPAPERLPGQRLNLIFGTNQPAVSSPGTTTGTLATVATPTATTVRTPTQQAKGKEACAGCFLPTTTTKRPPALRPSQQPSYTSNTQPTIPNQGGSPYGNPPSKQQGGNQKTFQNSNRGTQNSGNGNQGPITRGGGAGGQLPKVSGGLPFGGNNGGGGAQQGIRGSTVYNPVDINNMFSPRDQPVKPVIGLGPSLTDSVTPSSKTGGISPKIITKTPGQESEGLPPGVTEDDVMNLLYRFNYTVGFHGHHEDGYVGGNKRGDYFFDGRDGTERRVEYIANEFGYQPNITLIPLGDNDIRRPKEESEKEFGLKGYEFKWFRNP